MKKNIVKINESALRGIIAKSVRKALKEGIGDEAVRGLFGKTSDEGRGTFSEIDNALQERGIDAYVSKFFSDEGRVMVMVKSHENDGEIKNILSQFGYGECVGQGIDWIQFTKGESAVNESKKDKDMKKNIVKIDENTLKQIVAESVKRVLKEGSFEEDIFDVYTNVHYQDAPCYVKYQSVLYQIPEQFVDMLSELNNIDGRRAFLAAITSGKFPTSSVSTLTLKGHGYQERSFNANAY